jgi:hypothetical protein
MSDRLCGLVDRVPGYRSRGSGFNSGHYQIFWIAVCLEWGPLSFVSTIEEPSGRNSSRFSLENWEYGHRDPLCWPRDTLYLQKLALTLPTSGLVSIVCSRTKTMEFRECHWYTISSATAVWYLLVSDVLQYGTFIVRVPLSQAIIELQTLGSTNMTIPMFLSEIDWKRKCMWSLLVFFFMLQTVFPVQRAC